MEGRGFKGLGACGVSMRLEEQVRRGGVKDSRV